MSIYLLAYALAQVPAGMLTDRLGRKRLIIPGILLSSGANSAISLVPTFDQIIACRAVAGLGAATYYPASSSLLFEAFPASKSRALGIAYSGLGAGSILAIVLGGLIAQSMNWRFLFYLSCIFGILGASLFYRYVRETSVESVRSVLPSAAIYKNVLANKRILSLFSIHLIILHAYFSLMTFIPTYLVRDLKLSVLVANTIFLALPAIEMVGGPLLGSVADRIGKGIVIATGSAAITMFITTIPAITMPSLLFVWIALVGFFTRGTLTVLSASIADRSPASLLATTLGWYNLVGFLGSAIGPLVFGFLADVYGFVFAFIAVGTIVGFAVPIMALMRSR